VTQLECEDCTVGPDSNSKCDVHIIHKSIEVFHALILQCLLVADDHHGEAVTDSDKSGNGGDAHDDPLL
jgi:hypothetical protein